MAGAYVQSASADQVSSSATLGVAYNAANLTSGSLLVCVALWNSATQTCTVADSANGAWTNSGGPQTGAGNLAAWRAQVFYFLNNASVVKPTVTMTISAAVPERMLAIHEYTGVTALDVTASYRNLNVSGNAATNSITPSVSNGVVFAFDFNDQTAPSVSAPFTLREHGNFGSNATADDEAASGGAGITATFGTTGADNILGIGAFKSGGAAVTQQTFFRLFGP